ncbi:MAG: hypothetical protein J3K34DRAFT_45379 [Monoraphidium minutum]|nr:MAG: hypothetical protein J3K34DRAFT_45379 [Monoraphidium minutum]
MQCGRRPSISPRSTPVVAATHTCSRMDGTCASGGAGAPPPGATPGPQGLDALSAGYQHVPASPAYVFLCLLPSTHPPRARRIAARLRLRSPPTRLARPAAAHARAPPSVCQAFSGQEYEFCGADLPECKGNAFAVVTSEKLQVNAEVDRLAGADAWPAAGTWITGLGMRAGAAMSVVLRMRKDAEYTVVPDGAKTRALPPKGAAGLRALVASAAVNDKNVLGMIGSGDTLQVGGGHAVHFPSTTHSGDATDGPVMVIETPDSTWTWYLESEDTWHLDFKLSLKADNTISAMHGLLGQSLHWTPTTEAAVEGGDDLAYIVADGLLGTDFKYSLFDKRAAPTHRALLISAPGAPPLAAGTPAALARGN